MKNTRRIFAVVLVIVLMTLAFTACLGNDKKEPVSEALVIGGIGPTTGSNAIYGLAVKNGAQLAVDEINANGGVNGMKLELKFEDDEADPQKAANAYNTLVDAGMQALLGTVTSGSCENVVKLTKEDNMFQLTPSATSLKSIESANAFRVCFNDPEQGARVAQYISEVLKLTKVAVIYNSGDVYSTGILEKFKTVAAESNLNIVSEQSFTDSNASDFKVQLQKISSSDAEIVFLPIYYEAAAAILTQNPMKDMKFIGCDGLDGVISQLGEKNVGKSEGVLLTTPFNPYSDNEKVKKFTASFKEKFNGNPNQFAANAYDGVYIIKAALEKANVKDPNIKYSDLANLLIPAIKDITFEGITGTITWGDNGEPNKEAKFVVVKNGIYEDIK